MAKHNLLGKMGEDAACYLLKRKGYHILERNWRFKRMEVDIIALFENQLIFVEVKARSRSDFGHPEEAVSAQKERLLMRAASAYIRIQSWEQDIRFDIISVVFEGSQKRISHIEDAFFPYDF